MNTQNSGGEYLFQILKINNLIFSLLYTCIKKSN
jgi:hypothetical protein